MKRSFLIAIKEFITKFSPKPWACFETCGPDTEGRVAFSISANQAFLRLLQSNGMAGQNDEETLQLFFLQMQMRPDTGTEIDNTTVNPSATPNLSSEATRYIQ